MAKSSRTQQPITRHPLFPAILALWFGALFGLGSLAIRATLLESAVVAIGIDLLVPAAAPPLGVTARILLALAMALVGGLVGVTIGLRMGRVKAEAPQRRRTSLAAAEPPLPQRSDAFAYAEAETPRRPLSAFDDLPDHEQIDSEPIEGPSPSRRRQLAMEEPTRPDYARAFAPLPGASPDASELAVLELGEPLIDEFQPENWAPEDSVTDIPADTSRPFEGASPAEAPAMIRRFDAVLEPVEEDDRGLPPRNLGRSAQASGAAESISEQIKEVPVAIEPLQPVAFTPGCGTAAEQLRAAALETLSQIQLIERLALSMQQRREAAAQAAAQPESVAESAPVAPAPMRFGFEPKEPIELPELTNSPFASPQPAASGAVRAFDQPSDEPEEPAFTVPAMPAAMRPIGLDLADDAEDEIGVPAHRFAFPPAAPAPIPTAFTAPEEDEMDIEDAADESYSSLLGLGQVPLRQPLVRIEEPAPEAEHIEPVVVFPGHGSRPFAAPAPATPEPAPVAAPLQPGARPFDAPAAGSTPAPTPARVDPEETERALRAALATLQRMSGAA